MWSGRQDSNLRHLAPKASALIQAELRPGCTKSKALALQETKNIREDSFPFVNPLFKL
jgi:hypothetical protein